MICTHPEIGDELSYGFERPFSEDDNGNSHDILLQLSGVMALGKSQKFDCGAQ
jgi:hypothetical protein